MRGEGGGRGGGGAGGVPAVLAALLSPLAHRASLPQPRAQRALTEPVGQRTGEEPWASAGTVHVAATSGSCREAFGFVFKV